TSLNNHIKCGNSLIDDPEVAGDKAFDWNKEFPSVFRQKENQAYHVTWVTHNARTSQRMKQFGVEKGAPFLMSDEQEAFITREIVRMVEEDGLNVMAYNICKDHVHMLLVCEPDELSNIVRKLKGRSSQKLKEALGIPKEEKFQLWAQKFNRKPITDRDGLANVQQYIFHNRRKHGLPPLDGDELNLKDPSWEGKLESDYEPGDEETTNQDKELQQDQDDNVNSIRDKGLQPLASDGKSLSEVINDMCLTEEEAFRPEYTGGFDVVIGNPPYVRQELFGEIKPYLEGNFKVFEGTSDLFAYFYEKSFLLLKEQGVFGFISNTFDKTKAANKLRKHLSKQTTFETYVDFTEVQVFEGATTYPIILTARNKRTRHNQFTYIKIPKKSQSKEIDIESQIHTTVEQSSLNPKNWDFNSVEEIKVLEKLKKHKKIEEQFGKTYRGIVTGFNEAFIINGSTKSKLEDEHVSSKELIKPLFEGKDLSKWHTPDTNKYIIFTRRGTDIDKYPAIKNFLEQYRERLTPRNSPEMKVGRKPGPYEWHEIQDAVDYYEEFEKPKLTWPNLQSTNKFCLDEKEYYINAPSVVLPVGNKTLLCICNSSLIWFFLKSICVVRSGGYIEVKPQYFEQIPIPELKNEEVFEKKADQIIEWTKELQTVQENLRQLLLSKFDIPKLSRKLQSWHELTGKQFLKELKKKKVELSLDKEAEWLDYFTQQKSQADALKTQIAQTDKEIDTMVYELYGLTEEEVRVVEGE
ncbi:MAG: TaqI-like C-terminal specificity domain-containing protein, partial [Candidatus Paceibacterota bacterium]